jgi:hypothetical protein
MNVARGAITYAEVNATFDHDSLWSLAGKSDATQAEQESGF